MCVIYFPSFSRNGRTCSNQSWVYPSSCWENKEQRDTQNEMQSLCEIISLNVWHSRMQFFLCIHTIVWMLKYKIIIGNHIFAVVQYMICAYIRMHTDFPVTPKLKS